MSRDQVGVGSRPYAAVAKPHRKLAGKPALGAISLTMMTGGRIDVGGERAVDFKGQRVRAWHW